MIEAAGLTPFPVPDPTQWCQHASEATILERFGLGSERWRARGVALECIGLALYGQAVDSARNPAFYHELLVPDTLDGRFDMICLHVSLLNRRLLAVRGRGGPLAQSVFGAMFADMDGCLRENGVGDMGVPRRVKAMWEAYRGRAATYGAALDSGDAVRLARSLRRNVWRSADDGSDDARGTRALRLAEWALAQDRGLRAQADAELAAGTVWFAAPESSTAREQ